MSQNTLETGESMPSSENGLTAEIRKYLDGLERNKIYYPFEYGKILSLYGLRETEGGKELLNKKHEVLKQIIDAIESEKEKKSWIPSESNIEIEAVLEELIVKN